MIEGKWYIALFVDRDLMYRNEVGNVIKYRSGVEIKTSVRRGNPVPCMMRNVYVDGIKIA